MSGTFKTSGGESWSDVARRATGHDTDASAIERANPGVFAPLPAGVTLRIPTSTEINQKISDDPLTITVSGQRIGTVANFELSTAIDGISKCGFTVPNEPEISDLLEPVSFPFVTVDSYGERLFSGRAKTPDVDNGPDANLLEVECFSYPAVMETCPPPNTSFPLEFRDASLEWILTHITGTYGLQSRYDADEVARFKRVDIQQDQPGLAFLQELATQRGLVLYDDPYGVLVVHNGTGGELVANLDDGKHPVSAMRIAIDDDRYYSHVTVTMPSKMRRGKTGKSWSIPNPLVVPGIIRPYPYEAKDVDEGELETAARSVAARAFAELVDGTATLSTWKNNNGSLYRPGQLISVTSPKNRVYRPYQFLVSMVTYKRDIDSETIDISFNLPGVYGGEIPEVMPWQR